MVQLTPSPRTTTPWLPLKDMNVKPSKGKKTAPYYTEFRECPITDIIVNSDSGTPSVPNSEQNVGGNSLHKPPNYVIAKTEIASRLMPRMRMLRRVLNVLPRSFTICEGFRVTCHIEQLECGHTHVAYSPNYGAKRRNCKSCVNEEQEHQKAVNE